MDRVIVFTERVLPSTCTYIPAQVDLLHNFAPTYAGLVPANKNLELDQVPILLRTDRSPVSKVARELYRWTMRMQRFPTCTRQISRTFKKSGSDTDPCALC